MTWLTKAMSISCAAFSVNAAAGLSPAFAQLTETFHEPMIKGYRLDLCLHWGRECGQAAAEACDGHVVEWKTAPDIGASSPTYVMGDDKVCTENFCDGFKFITCKYSAD